MPNSLRVVPYHPKNARQEVPIASGDDDESVAALINQSAGITPAVWCQRIQHRATLNP